MPSFSTQVNMSSIRTLKELAATAAFGPEHHEVAEAFQRFDSQYPPTSEKRLSRYIDNEYKLLAIAYKKEGDLESVRRVNEKIINPNKCVKTS